VTFLRILGATAQKDFRTAISYRVGFVTSIIATFWGLFAFRFVSKLVNSGQFSSSSTSYFKYTVVGLLFASILEPTAVGTSVSARNDQVQGTLEYLSTQPVRRAYIGFSWSAFNLLQSLLVAAIVVLLTIPLGFSVSDVNVPVVLVVIPLTILIFGAVGNMGASLVILLQQGVPLVAGLLSIIGIISGTLFPVTVFPPWLQFFAHLSPLTYALDALRSATLADQPPTNYALDFVVLVGFAVVLLPLSGHLLERSFRIAQRRGSLSTF
jgi:ABC-2 type transport system permease protein